MNQTLGFYPSNIGQFRIAIRLKLAARREGASVRLQDMNFGQDDLICVMILTVAADLGPDVWRLFLTVRSKQLKPRLLVMLSGQERVSVMCGTYWDRD